MNELKKYFKNKKILITGHTGFKGSWLTLYLLSLGGKVMGKSKDIPTDPSLIKILKLQKKIIHNKADIRNLKKIKKLVLKFNPDFVFHLAAQSLVKKSYLSPLETWTTNLNGTINLLECLRAQKKRAIAVIITSDKTYKNKEIKKGYIEKDELGGLDPYGASKSAADLAINSYLNSYFKSKNNNKLIGVARAGNVIGGGDWSDDRLIPDCFKQWLDSKQVIIRNPNSTRPWQHVLDVIHGYLTLSINLSKNKKLHGEAFNFGPTINRNYKVIDILKLIKKYWPNAKWIVKKNRKQFFENTLLQLNSKKAKKYLNWSTKLVFKDNIKMTVNWYKEYSKKKNNLINFSLNQIKKINTIR